MEVNIATFLENIEYLCYYIHSEIESSNNAITLPLLLLYYKLYVKVLAWSGIGLNFNSSTLMPYLFLNLWVLPVANNFAGWFATGLFLSYFL